MNEPRGGKGTSGVPQHQADAPSGFSSKRGTKSGSKYDYVKVRVWLSERTAAASTPKVDWNLESSSDHNAHEQDSSYSPSTSASAAAAAAMADKKHYYVLSRFLLARMLTAARVPKKTATQIMLELKKRLVDEGRLDVTQKQLEHEVFSLLELNGLSKKHVDCFGMITSFYHLKIPLIVFICGTAGIGKSAIATGLAERLNLPNVLQTDLFAQIIRMSENSPLNPNALWDREDLEPGEGGGLLHEFKRECACVWRSVQGDLQKCVQDGKSIIMEGTYLDPAMFSDGLGVGAAHGDAVEDPCLPPRPPPIVVPIVLAMEGETHARCLDQWMGGWESSEMLRENSARVRAHAALREVHDYYVKFARRHPQSVRLCFVDPMSTQDTVDELHSHLLDQIADKFSQGSRGVEGEGDICLSQVPSTPIL